MKSYLQTTLLFITSHGFLQGSAQTGSPHLLPQPPNTELKSKPTTTAITAFFMITPLFKFKNLIPKSLDNFYTICQTIYLSVCLVENNFVKAILGETPCLIMLNTCSEIGKSILRSRDN